jgi:hypothetical protein
MLLPPRAELPLSSSPPRAGTAAPPERTARRPALTLSASNSRPTRRASRTESTVVGQHRHRQDYIAPRCRSAVRSAGECVPAAQPRDARNRRRSPRRRVPYCGYCVVGLYNHEHRHSGLRYVTPAQRHAGEDRSVLAVRHALYQQAREANPRRWSGPTRNWTPIGAVTLNPERDSVVAAALQPMLSGSTDGPALSSRPGDPAAAARSGGDGRRAATRSHAQQGEHGEAGEHRTFAAASTVAASSAVGRHRPPPPG